MILIFDQNGNRITDFGTNSIFPMGVPYEPKEGEYIFRIHDDDPQVQDILRATGIKGNIVNGEVDSISLSFEPIQIPLDEMKASKIVELKRQCEATIVGGMQSSVILASTGVAHVYPTDRDDQLNMSGTANAAQLKPLGTSIEFKTKDTGKYEIHTQDEIKAVSIEVYEHVLNNLKRVNDLAGHVMAATTTTEIDAIVW